jgi:hypothetical protein
MSQPIAAYCSISQHIAAYRSISQHIAAYCRLSQHIAAYCSISQHIAAYRSISQAIAAYRSILQAYCSASKPQKRIAAYCSISQHCTGLLQRIEAAEAYCSVLQHVLIAHRSMCLLQRIEAAVSYCSVLQSNPGQTVRTQEHHGRAAARDAATEETQMTRTERARSHGQSDSVGRRQTRTPLRMDTGIGESGECRFGESAAADRRLAASHICYIKLYCIDSATTGGKPHLLYHIRLY